MKFDSAGLGYTRRGSRVAVHYPARLKDGRVVPGAGGSALLDYPFRFPDANEATRERVAIIESLEDELVPPPSLSDTQRIDLLEAMGCVEVSRFKSGQRPEWVTVDQGEREWGRGPDLRAALDQAAPVFKAEFAQEREPRAPQGM